MVWESLFKNFVKKPITVRFPFEKLETAPRYRGRHKFDIDKCISCGTCARVCPNRAIEMVPAENKAKYPKVYPQVDLGKCCFCALCEEFCPTGALKLTQDYFLATFDPANLIYHPEKQKK